LKGWEWAKGVLDHGGRLGLALGFFGFPFVAARIFIHDWSWAIGIGAVVGLLLVFGEGAYQEWVEADVRARESERKLVAAQQIAPHVPANRDAIVAAVHSYENATLEYTNALLNAVELRRQADGNAGMLGRLQASLWTRQDRYKEAEDQLELQEQIAGRDFHIHLSYYRMRFHVSVLTMEMSTTPEPFAVDDFLEATRKILRDMDTGRLYTPFPATESVPDTSGSPNG
jgi:hypothetical protein